MTGHGMVSVLIGENEMTATESHRKYLADVLAKAVVYVPGKATPLSPLKPVSEIVSGGFAR